MDSFFEMRYLFLLVSGGHTVARIWCKHLFGETGGADWTSNQPPPLRVNDGRQTLTMDAHSPEGIRNIGLILLN